MTRSTTTVSIIMLVALTLPTVGAAHTPPGRPGPLSSQDTVPPYLIGKRRKDKPMRAFITAVRKQMTESAASFLKRGNRDTHHWFSCLASLHERFE